MDYNAEITVLKAEKAQLKTELDRLTAELILAGEGSARQLWLRTERHDIRHSIDVINEQITAFAKLLRPPAVARSESQSGDNSESVASTTHYAGLNQFQVHIPSEYDSKLRPNIQRDFYGVRGACIETKWQTIGGRLGVSLTVCTTVEGRGACVTILQTYLHRLPTESEMFPLLHRPPRKFRMRHHAKDSTIDTEGFSSGATHPKPDEVE